MLIRYIESFHLYKTNQAKQRNDSVPEMTPTKIRNHIIYNAMVGQKDQSIVENVLDSSIKILSSKNCPLNTNDMIHCLFHLCAMTHENFPLTKKLHPLVRSVVIDNIKIDDKQLTTKDSPKSNLCEWTNESVINSFMLLVEAKMLVKNEKEFMILFKEICDNDRIYTVEQLRRLIVYIKERRRLIGNKEMHTNIELLYKNNISSILAKTDIPTFFHFITFFNKIKLSIPNEEHKKLSKMACKRISRILEMKEPESSKHNKYDLTPYLALLKMLECLTFLRYFEKEYLVRVNSDIQKIIEMKGKPNFSFLCKVLDFINRFERYDQSSQRLYDYCIQTILIEMRRSSFIDNMTLSRMKELLLAINSKNLITKSFSTEEEKDEFKKLLKGSLVKCLKTKSSSEIVFAFMIHTTKTFTSKELSFLVQDKDYMEAYLKNFEKLSNKTKPNQFYLLGCNLIQALDPLEEKENLHSESEDSSEDNSESSSEENNEHSNISEKKFLLNSESLCSYKLRILKAISSNIYSKVDVVDTFKLDILNYNLNYWGKLLHLKVWEHEDIFKKHLQQSIDANLFIYPKFIEQDLNLIQAIHNAKKKGFGKDIDYKSYKSRLDKISTEAPFESVQKTKMLFEE